MEPQVLGQARGVQGVRVRQQQVGAAVGVPARAHGAALQPREMRQQARRAPVVRGQAGPLLALAPRPGLLLAAGGRRLVQGIDGRGVGFSQMRVGVGRLRVSQLLVGRWKVGWWLVFGDSGMREGRRGAVEVLPGGGEVGEARVPIAARVVAILGEREAETPLGRNPAAANRLERRRRAVRPRGRIAPAQPRPRGLPSSWGAGGGAPGGPARRRIRCKPRAHGGKRDVERPGGTRPQSPAPKA